MRALAALLLLAGCSPSTNDQGLEALMRVANAQYYPGTTPAAMDGPAILSFYNSSNLIRAGQKSKPLSGLVTRETTAIAVYLEGDTGYWIIIPGAEDPTANLQLAFAASLSFSPALKPGMYSLTGRAVDDQGHFGPPSKAMLTAADLPPDNSTLTVSLSWDRQADLDLHVVIPYGTEIWAKNINSHTPPKPGDPPDPTGYLSGGILDFDSNANCVIDGRRQEDVYWTQPPPSGDYLVRVDTPSLCGEPQAIWTVTATLGGQSLGVAHGVSLDADTIPPHVQGAGVLALKFTVP
jgi:hypothetical protein